MSDFLVDHAKANVWCTPDQDRQYIFKPAKISPMEGAFNRVNVLYDSINLPSLNERYHVYQIGQIPPELLNIGGDINVWRPISRVCKEQNLLMALYVNNGIQFPRFAAYVLQTLDKTIVIAVKDIEVIPQSLRTQDLYIRFYSNAYFSSIRNDDDGHPDGIYVYGSMMTSTADIMAMQVAFNTYRTKPYGYAYGFINGYYSDTLLISTIAVGDVVEFVYDSTIRLTFDYPVSELSTFNSVLDNKLKYLLHSANFNSTTIEFEDDIDFFVYKRQSGTNMAKGLYYHKNQTDAVRSITHVDYSVPSTYLQGYVDNGGIFTTLSDITIRMHVRYSGYQRPLMNEANRIKELYKLPSSVVTSTLLGIDSSFTQWSAATLENSAYPLLMRSYEQFITREMVLRAYGYNAVSKVIADSPLKLISDGGSQKFIELPVATKLNSTIYEYDAGGVLLGFYQHINGERHYAVNSTCTFIEALTGLGGNTSGSYYDVEQLTLEPDTEYRYYKALKNLDGSPSTWEETGIGDDFTKTNNVVTCNLDLDLYRTLIRRDSVWIAYDYYTDAQDPVFRFSINANGVFGGTNESRPIQVPYGEMDLWFNGRGLVENIDYYINWPEICIVTKRYVVGNINTQQKITIRARGFNNFDNISYPNVVEYGYVKNGEISRNAIYNIRDDKVVRIIADGRTLLRENIYFGEDGIFVDNSPLNGTAYQIRDIRVFMNAYLEPSLLRLGSSHKYRQDSVLMDRQVSDYLTLKLPEAPATAPSVGLGPYELYSPFCARIAMDIYLGNITQDFAETDPTDPEVQTVMEPYEFLLAYEPCLDESTDWDLVTVAPHPYTTTLPLHYAGFRLLQKVIRIYLNDRITINNYFTVS